VTPHAVRLQKRLHDGVEVVGRPTDLRDEQNRDDGNARFHAISLS